MERVEEIGELITERPLCLSCVAANVSAKLTAVDQALRQIATMIEILVVPRSTCRFCGKLTVTFCIGERPEAPPVSPDETQEPRPQHCAWCGTAIGPQHEVRLERSVLYHRICLDVRERILNGQQPDAGAAAF